MKGRKAVWACGLLLATLPALGCARTDRRDVRDTAVGGTGAGGASAFPTGPGGQSGAGPAAGGANPSTCEERGLGPSPLLRLSRFQLENTLRDLFKDAPAVAQLASSELRRLPAETDPFAEPLSTAASEPSAVAVAAYHDLAHRVALRLSEDVEQLQAFIGCDPAAGDEIGCRDRFLDSFLSSTYRRPPSEDEREAMQGVFARGEKLGASFASGVRAVVEVVLQGPDFLYLVERGDGDAEEADGAVALSGYETAARLAYFLTGSAPDAELREAAEDGPFTADAVEAHARRLVGTPPSRAVARDFIERLLRLDDAGTGSASSPTYTPAIAALTRQETALFVDHVVFDGAGTFRALLSQPSTWINSPLAQFYGIPYIYGDAFQEIQFDDGRRAGILTQSSFLNATSPEGRSNTVARGLAVVERLLCIEIPRPPGGVTKPRLDTPDGASARQRLELATESETCSGCHSAFDPIGFAFENYDSVGLWRDLDNGQPVDATGSLLASDVQGGFENAVQLVTRLAESEDAHRCFAKNWLTYARGRAVVPADDCVREQVEAAFLASDGSIVEMLVALATTAPFRYRLASESSP